MNVNSINVSVNISGSVSISGGLGSFSAPTSLSYNESFTQGSGADQLSIIYNATIALVASTPQTLDLNAVLTYAGETISFVKLKGIMVKNTETATGKLVKVGAAASNAFYDCFGSATDYVKVGPKGVWLLTSPVDGYTVTPATGDQLKFDPGANNVTINVYFLGN